MVLLSVYALAGTALFFRRAAAGSFFSEFSDNVKKHGKSSLKFTLKPLTEKSAVLHSRLCGAQLSLGRVVRPLPSVKLIFFGVLRVNAFLTASKATQTAFFLLFCRFAPPLVNMQ